VSKNYLVSIGERVLVTLARLLISIYVGNLLGIEEMGRYALISATLAFSYLIAEAGIGSFIIKNQSNEYLSVAVTLNTLFSLIVAIISSFVVFVQKDMIGISIYGVFLVTTYVFLNSTNSIRNSILIRDERFLALAILNVVSTILYALASFLCIKYLNIGFESLLVGSVLSTLPLIVMVSLPRIWTLSIDRIKVVLGYSMPLMLSNVANGAYMLVFANIFPKKINYGMLGIYSRSDQLSNTMTSVINTSFNRVNFPRLSKLKKDNLMLFEKEFFRTTKTVFIVILIAIVLATVLIEPVVFMFFTEEWKDVVDVFRLLAMMSWTLVMYSHCLNLYKVNGETRYFIYLELFRLFGMLSLLIIVLENGVESYISGAFAVHCILILFILVHMKSRYNYKTLFKSLGALFIVGVIFTITLYTIY
jgi:O-antigen/teichoic acid export membrane protein